MAQNYILHGKTPVPEPDIIVWTQWFGTADRTVAKTRIGQVKVSTVFLGIDHRMSGDGPPVLFETMVFGGEYDQECDRYATWEEAEAGHQRMVNKVLDGAQQAWEELEEEARATT